MLYPLSEIVTIYFAGLIFLYVSLSLGFLFQRWIRMGLFEQLFLGYLVLLCSYAIIKTSFQTIALLIPIWLVLYLLLFRDRLCLNVKLIDVKSQILSVTIIWTLIYVLKAFYFWNYSFDLPNLLFADYPNYIKIAEGFQLSGHENALGHRNVLFAELNFLQPYRTNDLWLPSLGLDLTNFGSYYIWGLFYTPLVWTLASISVYSVLSNIRFKAYRILLSVLALFAFSGSWYRGLINKVLEVNQGSYDPIGIIAYPKLAIVFAMLFMVLKNVMTGKINKAAFQLILLVFLVQSTVAVIPVIYGLLFFLGVRDLWGKRRLKKSYFLLLASISFITILFGLIYFNSGLTEREVLQMTSLDILNNENFSEFLLVFLKKSLYIFLSYFWLSILLSIILIYSMISKKAQRYEILALTSVFYFSSTALYAWYANVGDAYQFSTNLFGPFVVTLIIYLLLDTNKSLFKKIVGHGVLIIVSIIGFVQITRGSSAFNSPDKIYQYSKQFLMTVGKTLPELQSPYGIIYYGKNEITPRREDFPLHEASFLKLFGRNYDVFNLNAANLTNEEYSADQQKYCVYAARQALNIYNNTQSDISLNPTNSIEKNFLNTGKFSFCISKTPLSDLPIWISSRVELRIFDSESKIFFYSFKD